MGNRVVTLILVAVVGVLLGLGVVMKQAKDPILHEMLKQQNEIVKVQNRIEQKLNVPVANTGSNQQGLEQRVTVLENQMKALVTMLKDAQGGGRQGPPPEDYTKVYDIPVDGSPVRGNPNAAVTIVAFEDFQCPFCSRFYPPILETLKAYPDDVKFMVKNFPLSFHPQAKPGAKAALAAGEQGKYWEMVDALLADNKDLSEDRFKEEAKKLGLDVDKFMKDYTEKDAQWEAIFAKDMELAEKVGVQGTPTFYINGKKTMARDLAGYKREIDQILGK